MFRWEAFVCCFASFSTENNKKEIKLCVLCVSAVNYGVSPQFWGGLNEARYYQGRKQPGGIILASLRLGATTS
jgi:hypothetical protein